MTRGILVLSSLLTLPWVAARAQSTNGDRWQLTLSSGEYVWDIRLLKLDGGRLVFQQNDTTGSVKVDQVDELRLIQKTEARIGTGETAGAFAALTGADDEIYDMKPLDFAARVRAIQQVFLLHPPPTDPGKP